MKKMTHYICRKKKYTCLKGTRIFSSLLSKSERFLRDKYGKKNKEHSNFVRGGTGSAILV